MLAPGYGLLTSTPAITSLHTQPHSVNPLLAPLPHPRRVYSFQTNLMGGGAYQRRGAYLRRGGLFDVEKTMVSVLHKKKKTRIQRGKAQVQEVRGCAAEDQNKSELPVGE